MKVRRNRENQTGISNRDVRSTKDEKNGLLHQRPVNSTSINFLSQARPQKFHDLVQSRMERRQLNPMATTKEYYQSQKKNLKETTLLGYPRTAHLEEQDKLKRVFTGESNTVFNEKLFHHTYRTSSEQALPQLSSQMTKIIANKQRQNAEASQETQLVGLQQYTKDTLQDKIDLDKVKGVRRALRRRYANRKNLAKIFRSWDQEGKGYLTIQNIHDMVNKLGLKINLNEAQVLVAASDKNYNGLQSMDEFMEMVYNPSDTLTVDLQGLTDIRNPQDYQAMMMNLNQDNQKQQANKHANQLTLILQKNINALYQKLLVQDQTQTGRMTDQHFQQALKGLDLDKQVMDEHDLTGLVEKYSVEGQVDYRGFVRDVKESDVRLD